MRHSLLFVLTAAMAAAQPLTLESALELAAKQNPGVQITRLRLLERQAQSSSTRANYLPQAELVVATAYQTNNLQGIGLAFPGMSDRIGPYRTFNARPVVTQKVLDFSLLSSIRAARLQAAAAKLDIEAAREETQAAVISLFLQTFQAQSRVRAAQARLRTADALLTQVSDREKAGASSQLDVARNRQQRETEQLALINAEQDLAQLRPALSELLGGTPVAELTEPKLSTNLGSPADSRPDIRAAAERVKVAEQELQRIRRERWPRRRRSSAAWNWPPLASPPRRKSSTIARPVPRSRLPNRPPRPARSWSWPNSATNPASPRPSIPSPPKAP